MIKVKIVYSDANNKILISNQVDVSNKNDTNNYDNSGYKTIKVDLEEKISTTRDSKLDSRK